MILPAITLALATTLTTLPASSDATPSPELVVTFTKDGPTTSIRVPDNLPLLFPDLSVHVVSAEENAAKAAAVRAAREAEELSVRIAQLREAGLVVSDQGWVRPLSRYTFSSDYGPRGAIPAAGVGAMFHNGIDLAAPSDTPIRAPFEGTVTYSGWGHRGNSGWAIELTHPDGTATMYNHMAAQSALEVGTVVAAGQQVGAVGNTGNSSGPHAHVTAWVDDEHVDPKDYFAERGIYFR